MCYTEDEEKEELAAKLHSVKHLVHFHDTRTVPVGNAADPRNVPMQTIPIATIEDLERIPRGCILGNALIDEMGDVHGCCWSRTVTNSRFSESAAVGGLAEALLRLEAKPEFQSVRAVGFLGALTSQGREALVRLARGRSVANECELCMLTLAEGGEDLWAECRDAFLDARLSHSSMAARSAQNSECRPTH